MMLIDDWGLIDYEEGLKRQRILVEEVINFPKKERIILCSHPPLVTLGKDGKLSDIYDWKGDIYHIERGGKATYHGPSQLIVYPIINLSLRKKNLLGHLCSLEQSLILALEKMGLKATGSKDRKSPTGVWINASKIASIGIAVKRWVTYHGMAINLDKDPLAFNGINPCGFNKNIMISLEEILHRKVKRKKIKKNLCHFLLNILQDMRL